MSTIRQAARRPEGNIRERWPGVFNVRLYVGTDENGKKVYHFGTAHSRAEAKRMLKGFIARRNGTARGQPLCRQPLGEWWTEWVDGARDLSERTRADLRYCLDHYVTPELRATKLDALTDTAIERWINGLSTERRLSARTVTKALVELKWCLSASVRRKRISFSPAQYVRPPRPEKAERVWLDTDERVARFLDAAARVPHGDFFIVMLMTGARPSELLALRWDAIVGSTLTIASAMTVGRNGARQIGTTKTGLTRTLALGPDELAAFARRRKQQAAERLAAGPSYRDANLVFASSLGTPLSMTNLSKRTFHPILKAAVLPDALRPYDLRHSSLSLLASRHVDPAVIQQRAGHARIKTTYDNYIHPATGAQAEAIGILSEIAETGRRALERQGLG